MERCALCGARGRSEPRRLRVRCDTCGLEWRQAGDLVPGCLDGAPEDAEQLLRRGLFLDDVTYRIYASAKGDWYRRRDGAPIRDHTGDPAEGILTPLEARERAPGIALVMLSRPDDPRLAARLAAYRPIFGEVVVVLDQGTVTLPCGWDEGITVLETALDGDFGAQRTRGNDAATRPWVFHLDTDEWISRPLLRTMQALADRAGEDGLRALGVRRRNVVDGVFTDHWPDIQYRLMPAGERVVGRVHEQPAACRDWRDTVLSLTGGLTHVLSGDRLAMRTDRYDAMGQDPARKAEDTALTRRYAA